MSTREILVQRWKRLSGPQALVLVAVVITISYLALVPLVYLLWGTLVDEAGLTLDAFSRAYTAQGLPELIFNSLQFGLGATAVSLAVGVSLAYLTERTDVPFRSFIYVTSLVPLVIPGVLYTIAWIFLASPRIGLFTGWLEWLLGPEGLNVYSMTGMIVIQGMDNAPLVFLLMMAAFRSMDPSMEEAALTSGARLPLVIGKITLPLLRPALLAAVLIMTVRNLESFETPALLGIPGGVWVFTSRIWRVLGQTPPDYGQAGAYSIGLLILMSIGVYLVTRFSGRGREFETITGKGFRPRAMPLGRWRWPIAWIVVLYFFIAIVMPVFILGYLSVQPYYSAPSLATLTNLDFSSYAYVLGHDQSMGAFTNSLMLAIGSATLVMGLASVAAWLVTRSRMPGIWLVDNLAFMPLVIPGLVLGVALIFVYLRFPVRIYGTIWILLIAYVTKYIPYGMRYAAVSMRQIGGELEESAQTSGATWVQTFRRINLPLLVPGLIAGWLYIVMTSIRELSSSILLYSPGNEVLAVMIWDFFEAGAFAALGALGMIMIALLLVLALIARKVGSRFGVR